MKDRELRNYSRVDEIYTRARQRAERMERNARPIDRPVSRDYPVQPYEPDPRSKGNRSITPDSPRGNTRRLTKAESDALRSDRGVIDLNRKGGESAKAWFRRLYGAMRLMRQMNLVSKAMDVIDFLDAMYWAAEGNQFKPPNGWRRGGKCPTAPSANWQYYTLDFQGPNSIFHHYANECLAGQAGGEPLGSPIPSWANILIRGYRYPVADSWRYGFVDSWWRESGNDNQWKRDMTIGYQRDPNLERKLSGRQEFKHDTDYPEPQPDNYPLQDTSSQPANSSKNHWETGTSTGSARSSPSRTHTRTRTHARERKVMSKSKLFSIWFTRAMDAISEGADIVDAIFEALPEDVKKKWKKKSRGFGDEAGQYGIDGADWKLAALFYNWEKVDIEIAIKNLIKNGLEDAIIGGYQAHLPNNTGSAMEEGEKAFAKWLNDLLDSAFDAQEGP